MLHRPIQAAMPGQQRQQPGIAVGLIAHAAFSEFGTDTENVV
jgi:hypothetical protein